MIIEKVKVLRTLKAGDQLWKVGQIVTEPIPPDLLSEVRYGFVEIVSQRHETRSFVPEESGGTTSTTATVKSKAAEPDFIEPADLQAEAEVQAAKDTVIEKSKPVFKDEIGNESRKTVGRPKATTSRKTVPRRRKK